MIPPNDEPPPNEKKLRIAPFALHSARGLVRDQHTRRMTMFVIVILALVMLFLGSTVLAPALDAKAEGTLAYPINDFYLTNAICRASPTMRRCSEELLHGQSFAEAAE